MSGSAHKAHSKYVANLTKLAVQGRPTEFHKLLQLLDGCGMLARLYSQNIDGLEARVGFDLFSDRITRKCVLLHGSISTLRCEKCSAVFMTEKYHSSLDFGE
jgi:NAD-dependent histone deacetylase SIR2